MGKWAEDALDRFHSEASAERRSEELELVRHNKLQAGVEKLWKRVRKFVLDETKDFNKKLGREFFEVTDSEDEIQVSAPRGSVTCSLDARVPEITYTHTNPLIVRSPLPRSFRFQFGHDKETVVLVDSEAGVIVSAENAGGQLLDPLVK